MSISNAQPELIQVCALKSLAAIAPAAAGLPRCMNSSGTTTKPRAVKLPHHRAAASNPIRWATFGCVRGS